MCFPGCLHCEGRCFVGANQGNVIVSGEVTTETWVGNVKTMQNIDLQNGPPVGIGCTEVNPLEMFESDLVVQEQKVERNLWKTNTTQCCQKNVLQ